MRLLRSPFAPILGLFLFAGGCSPTAVGEVPEDPNAEALTECPDLVEDLKHVEAIFAAANFPKRLDEDALVAWMDRGTDVSIEGLESPVDLAPPADPVAAMAKKVAGTMRLAEMRAGVRPFRFSLSGGCARGMGMRDFAYDVPDGSKLTRVRVLYTIHEHALERLGLEAQAPIL
jgi:hypothetical protein